MAPKGIEKILKIKMVQLPEKLHVPSNIPASKIRIPSTYAEGDVQYEDDNENPVNEKEATHIRLTAKDKRSDLVVGPVKPRGILRLNIYLDENNNAVNKQNSSHSRHIVLNENYKAI